MNEAPRREAAEASEGPAADAAAERSHAMPEQSSEQSPQVHPEENYEDVTVYDLDANVEEQLLLAHNECTFIWANREGWPVGVIMSYVWRDGRFWLTASSQRARISAVRRDPRVCIVVTSTGSPMPRNKAITWKGTCTVRDDAETKAWFYPALAAALSPGDEAGQAALVSFLDSPRRVILEVEPTQRIGYDGSKMAKATASWLAAQNS
ncbi:MAG: pyridoxamine 5'-phosphate oxidase family protein [Acidimicrobiaceae bacterium]|nr:pyridoxamine 5'-phosphate oxidase family protein [Acidimicrobiaceae bacterium]